MSVADGKFLPKYSKNTIKKYQKAQYLYGSGTVSVVVGMSLAD